LIVCEAALHSAPRRRLPARAHTPHEWRL